MDATPDNHKTQPQARTLCTLPDILQRLKVSKSAVYVWISKNKFPKPCIVIGPRYTRWSVQDVDSWVNDHAAWIAANANGAAV